MSRRPVPREYADVLAGKSEEFFDFESTLIDYEDEEGYKLVGILNKGYSAEVYICISVTKKELVICKLFRIDKAHLLKHEVKMLRLLSNHENIIQLLAITFFTSRRAPGIILEKMDCDLLTTLLNLDEPDIKLYSIQILKALDYCHSKGIIHIDVKPNNILINKKTKLLKLTDWGSAEFYQPEKTVTKFACTWAYTAPELLVGCVGYNYAVDLWSYGCILASMIFRVKHLFNGSNVTDQLLKIIEILGSEGFLNMIQKYNEEMYSLYQASCISCSGVSLFCFRNDSNRHVAKSAAINLLQSIFQFDCEQRLTAREALNHKFLLNVKLSNTESQPSTSTV